MQPMTMKMRYLGVDTALLKSHILANPDRFPLLRDHEDLLRRDIPMDVEGFEAEVAAEKKAGRLSIGRENILMHGSHRSGEYIVNTTRILNRDGTDAESLSDAEREGRRQCVKLAAFLRRFVPGFADAQLAYTGPSIGVRGSRQLVGAYTITGEDILTRRKFDSAVAHSSYPIDIHNPSGPGTDSTFMQTRGDYYDIPFGTLYCREIANLLVVGRCLSATFDAQAAIRVTPTAGTLGQAGGAAAALAAAKDGDVRKVDIKALRHVLRGQGAYLAPRNGD